jgi:hypothetical protein
MAQRRLFPFKHGKLRVVIKTYRYLRGIDWQSLPVRIGVSGQSMPIPVNSATNMQDRVGGRHRGELAWKRWASILPPGCPTEGEAHEIG